MAGKWLIFEEWKRQLTSIANEYNTPLWDFNTIDQYSTESPPPLGDKNSQLKWYWEPAHYRQELGDLMLASMLNRDCGTEHHHLRFGSQIDIITLQDHLNIIALKLKQFMSEHPEVINRLMN